MSADPWHYPRPELARKYLELMSPGPAEAITLFSQRRTGKTAFLANDIADAAQAIGRVPVFVDLWKGRLDPGPALAEQLRMAALTLEQPKGFLQRIGRTEVTSVGLAGQSLSFKDRPTPEAPTDPTLAISYWGERMARATDKPIVLMIDEVQALATGKNAVDTASALRAFLQSPAARSGKVQPIFTGSSRDGIQRLVNDSKAAFYQYGAMPDFPSPDDGIARFMAKRLRESAGVDVNETKLLAAFEELERKPGPLKSMVVAMATDRSADVDKYLHMQIGELRAAADVRVELARLRPIEKVIIQRIADAKSLFSKEAQQDYMDRVGTALNNKSINDAVTKLRNANLVTKVGHGQYVIEDEEVAAAVVNELEDLAPKAPSATSVARAAMNRWLEDQDAAKVEFPTFAKVMQTFEDRIKAHATELLQKGTDLNDVFKTMQRLKAEAADRIINAGRLLDRDKPPMIEPIRGRDEDHER